MNIHFYIRSKKDIAHIRCSLDDGRQVKCYARTDIKIPVDWWDDKKETIRATVPTMQRTILVKRLSDLEQNVINTYIIDRQDKLIDSAWLDGVVNPPKVVQKQAKTFLELWDLCMCNDKTIGYERRKSYDSVRGKLERFDMVVRKLPVEWTIKDVDAFEHYVLYEPDYLSEANPDILARIRQTPGKKIDYRSQNFANDNLKKIKKVIRWLRANNFCKSDPFDVSRTERFKIASYKYADAVALTMEELDLIYNAKIPEDIPASMDKIRDMLCLHCYTGPRVGQFVQFTRENVVGGILQYIPEKTIGHSQNTVLVPLCENALRIIDKWNEPVRLFPFINVSGANGYNAGIKLLLRTLKINRPVLTINQVTGKQEMVPLCDFASTHTARKTFISCMLNNEVPKEIIAKMTGHSPNSRAFDRYPDIHIDTLKKVIGKTF